MDCVVDWILNSSYTMQVGYRVWKLCFHGNRQPRLQVSIRVSGWQSGQLPVQVRRLKKTWSGKLSDSLVTQQPSISTTKLEEGIVGDDGTSNQAMNR